MAPKMVSVSVVTTNLLINDDLGRIVVDANREGPTIDRDTGLIVVRGTERTVMVNPADVVAIFIDSLPEAE